MDRVLTMILAGGPPDALGVLGQHRAKTAVPFGGRYRLIDFPLSNCVNSGLRQIYILTQYNPRSLRRHIRLGRPWDLDRNEGGIRILLPYSGVNQASWFRGTADALIQNIDIIKRSRSRYVLVLSGDHIYKMDYRELFHRHVVTDADVTLATRASLPGDGRRFGMVNPDAHGRVLAFREKPGPDEEPDTSLGIYLFKRDFLLEHLSALAGEKKYDLVRDLIVPSVETASMSTYRFDGYWEDVGDLNAFYRANLLLVDSKPPMQLDDPAWPIYTRVFSAAPGWFGSDARCERSLIAAGCRIDGEVTGSILFPGVVIEKGARVENAVVFTGCRIERNAVAHQAILDKNVLLSRDALLSGGDGLAVMAKNSRLSLGERRIGSGEIKAMAEVAEGGAQ